MGRTIDPKLRTYGNKSLFETWLFLVALALMIAMACIILMCSGCNVYMSPDYQTKVQASSEIIDKMVRECPQADLNDCCAGLAEASRTLHLILDASYGRE